MSWTLYIPTAITGVVGLAGIGGAIWSARIASRASTTNLMRSIDAEGDRAREAEKRRLYAASLAAFSEMVSALAEYATSQHSSSSSSADDKKAAFSRFSHGHEQMNRSLEELMLIAPKDVGVQAVDLSNFIVNYIRTVSPNDLPDVKAAGLLRTGLIRAMRDDLGEPNW